MYYARSKYTFSKINPIWVKRIEKYSTSIIFLIIVIVRNEKVNPDQTRVINSFPMAVERDNDLDFFRESRETFSRRLIRIVDLAPPSFRLK